MNTLTSEDLRGREASVGYTWVGSSDTATITFSNGDTYDVAFTTLKPDVVDLLVSARGIARSTGSVGSDTWIIGTGRTLVGRWIRPPQ